MMTEAESKIAYNNLVPYVKLGKSTIHMMTEAESKIAYKQFGAIRKAGY